MVRLQIINVSRTVRRYCLNRTVSEKHPVTFVVDRREQGYGNFDFYDSFQKQRRVMAMTGREGCQIVMNLGCMTRNIAAEHLVAVTLHQSYLDVEVKRGFPLEELDRQVVRALEMEFATKIVKVDSLAGLHAPEHELVAAG